MSQFKGEEYQILDSTSVNSEGRLIYRDFKLSPAAYDGVSFNVATYVEQDGDPEEAIRRLIENPSDMKFNMDMYYDALESPPDNDTMF